MKHSEWAASLMLAAVLLGAAEIGYAQWGPTGSWVLEVVGATLWRLASGHLACASGAATWGVPIGLLLTGLLVGSAGWRKERRPAAAETAEGGDNE